MNNETKALRFDIEDGFNTIVARDYLERLESPEEMIHYLKTEQYFHTFENQLSLLINKKNISAKTIYSKKDAQGKQLVSKQNLSKWTRGRCIPKRDNLIRLCFALELNAIESNELIAKFAGDRMFSALNPDDVLYTFGLQYHVPFSQIEGLLDLKDHLQKDPYYFNREDIQLPFGLRNKKFISSYLRSIKEELNHKKQAAYIITHAINNPKIFLGEYEEGASSVKKVAQYMFGDDWEKGQQIIYGMMKGQYMTRLNFLKVIIACGYTEQDDINELLEKAGFFHLYARNAFDSMLISTSSIAILENKTCLSDYLQELSEFFDQYDAHDYVLYGA